MKKSGYHSEKNSICINHETTGKRMVFTFPEDMAASVPCNLHKTGGTSFKYTSLSKFFPYIRNVQPHRRNCREPQGLEGKYIILFRYLIFFGYAIV